MADNFSDNPLVGFKAFRDAHAGAPGSSRALAERAMTTRGLDQLRADVVGGRLPQVSYMISTAAESEHPGPSSPAQGADYVARVVEALTASPEVWSRTVLLVMFDENDGFFDHVPPPAPPSRLEGRALAGASSVDTTGEYHTNSAPSAGQADPPALMGRPYGLGPRAPMYVISPWSRGGYVNSQVFDHTSVIRFLERRFGVMEPNISAWRRSVCGDLTSAFDFKTPNNARLPRPLPATKAMADRARALAKKINPPAPGDLKAPVQAHGPRPSRALPYDLEVQPTVSASGVVLRFASSGAAGAVFHVYDRLRPEAIPRRYTVGPGQALLDQWPGAAEADHDLWILGPNGFHRHIRGVARNDSPVAALSGDSRTGRLKLTLANPGAKSRTLKVAPAAYALAPWTVELAPGKVADKVWNLGASRGWYDLLVTCEGEPAFARRYAGRVETGRDSITDPAMSGPATMAWSR
jgi:phospholipase C